MDSLPSSFNVIEAFFNYRPPLNYFELLEEEDHIFNFYDFIDYITSNQFEEKIEYIKESFVDDLILNYNISNSLDDITFTTENGEEYVIGGVSLLKRGDEAFVFLLTGQITDLDDETIKLKKLQHSLSSGREYLKIDEGLKQEAVKLFGKNNIWKTNCYCRIDLIKSTIDVRYVQKDIGNAYITITDDIVGFLNHDGEFLRPSLIKTYKKLREDIKAFSPIFEIATKCLYLPYYFNQFDELITEEEHETLLAKQKKRKALFKKEKRPSTQFDIKNKTVFTLDRNIVKSADTIYFGENQFKIERGGYWKKLDPNIRGLDKNKKPIHGKTWVESTKTWYEQDIQTLTVNLSDYSKITPKGNEGFLYIMRNASHDSNIFKIGLTRRNTKDRAKELSATTGSPDKFLVAQQFFSKDCVFAEKLIHKEIDVYRINDKREFFRIEYADLLNIVTKVIDQINNPKK